MICACSAMTEHAQIVSCCSVTGCLCAVLKRSVAVFFWTLAVAAVAVVVVYSVLGSLSRRLHATVDMM